MIGSRERLVRRDWVLASARRVRRVRGLRSAGVWRPRADGWQGPGRCAPGSRVPDELAGQAGIEEPGRRAVRWRPDNDHAGAAVGGEVGDPLPAGTVIADHAQHVPVRRDPGRAQPAHGVRDDHSGRLGGLGVDHLVAHDVGLQHVQHLDRRAQNLAEADRGVGHLRPARPDADGHHDRRCDRLAGRPRRLARPRRPQRPARRRRPARPRRRLVPAVPSGSASLRSARVSSE